MSPLGGIARAAAIAAVASFALGACSGDTEFAPSAAPSVNPTIYHPDSMSGQASDRAKAILARGVANGVLAREDLDEAAEYAMACLEAAGIRPMFTAPAAKGDAHTVSWGYDVGDGPDSTKADQLEALANECVDREYWPVAVTYVDQPQAVELQEAREQRWREEGITCLNEAGIPVDDDAPWDEVLTALVEDFLKRGDDSCHAQLGVG